MGTARNQQMAKWGEGDDRWIVEERADGTNVNAWHWTEKNITKLAEQKLKDAIANAEDCAEGCRLTSVSKFNGFVNLCNRKGKLKVTYSLEVTLKWKKESKHEPTDQKPSASACGSIMMDEVFDDDPDVEYTLDRKKTKGEGAEPDRSLQKVLGEAAKQHVLRLLEDLKIPDHNCLPNAGTNSSAATVTTEQPVAANTA